MRPRSDSAGAVTRIAACLAPAILATAALDARVPILHYSTETYVEARADALEGRLEKAEALWGEMLQALEGPLYSVDLATACGEEAAVEILDRLRSVHPVFTLLSGEGETGCHRILFGLFPGEAGVGEIVAQLPSVSLYPPTLVRIEGFAEGRPTLHEVRRFSPPLARSEPLPEEEASPTETPAPDREAAARQKLARHLFEEGKDALLRKDLNAAGEAFAQVLAIDPDNVSALQNLGIVHLYQADYASAATRFREALLRDPTYTKAYVNLGAALFALGKKDDAIVVLRKALIVSPDDFEVHYTIAGIYAETGLFVQAHEHVSRALEISPGEQRAKGLAAALPALPPEGEGGEESAIPATAAVAPAAEASVRQPRLRLREPETAPAAPRADTTAEPVRARNEAELLFMEGTRAYESGNLRAAERAFLGAAEMDPDNPNIHNNLGAVYMDQGRWEDAAGAFRKALAADPEHVKARINMGGALYNLGRKDEAIQILEEAEALAPGDPDVLYALALFLTHSGQRDRARALALRALERDPFNHKIRALEETLSSSSGRMYVAEPEIFLRQDPDRNASVVGKLRFGEPLEILQRRGVWVRVSSSDGMEGWVGDGMLTSRDPAS